MTRPMSFCIEPSDGPLDKRWFLSSSLSEPFRRPIGYFSDLKEAKAAAEHFAATWDKKG